MNILVLNYEYPPLGAGAAPVCRDLAVEMARQGNRVTVVTMGFGDLAEHELADGVEVIRLKCLRKHEHSCSPMEQLSFIINAERFLDQFLKKCSFDVCHAHFVFPTGPVALYVKKRYGIPFIMTAHGSDVEGHNKKLSMCIMHRLLRPAWKGIVRKAYAVTAPSKHLLRLMKRNYDKNRYVLIPNGLEIDKYDASGYRKEKRILVMGRLQSFKNVQTILQAISLLPEDIWNGWYVDILGDGPYRSELEKLSRELGINTRVGFHGWIENGTPEQLNYLKGASIYISASHFENCPMSVLEAMAAGCYPLLSDIEGHRQFFAKRADDYFFKKDDAEELGDKLKVLISAAPNDISEILTVVDYDNRNVTKKYIKLLRCASNRSDKTV